MLLPVGLDPDALRELASGDASGPGPAVIRKLRERCLLAVGSRSAVRELLEACNGCGSAELSQVLAQLVKSRLLAPDDGAGGPVPLDQLEHPGEVASWRELADLLVLAELRAEVIEARKLKGPPEVSTLRDAANTQAFDRLDARALQVFPSGTPRDRVWERAFAPLAQHSTRVDVVDRYFAKDLHDKLERRDPVGASGALWFLSRLVKTLVASVHVASSDREAPRAPGAPDAVDRAVLQATRPGFVTWYSVPGNFDHDRKVAFDGWASFSVHNGLGTFNGPELSERLTLAAAFGEAPRAGRSFEAVIGGTRPRTAG